MRYLKDLTGDISSSQIVDKESMMLWKERMEKEGEKHAMENYAPEKNHISVTTGLPEYPEMKLSLTMNNQTHEKEQSSLNQRNEDIGNITENEFVPKTFDNGEVTATNDNTTGNIEKDPEKGTNSKKGTEKLVNGSIEPTNIAEIWYTREIFKSDHSPAPKMINKEPVIWHERIGNLTISNDNQVSRLQNNNNSENETTKTQLKIAGYNPKKIESVETRADVPNQTESAYSDVGDLSHLDEISTTTDPILASYYQSGNFISHNNSEDISADINGKAIYFQQNKQHDLDVRMEQPVKENSGTKFF